MYRKKVGFQLMPENVETQCWITKTVWQVNSKTKHRRL